MITLLVCHLDNFIYELPEGRASTLITSATPKAPCTVLYIERISVCGLHIWLSRPIEFGTLGL